MTRCPILIESIKPIENGQLDMDQKPQAIRQTVFEHIRLLARASLQTQYEKDVPVADIPGELVSIFCDDLFHPKSPAFRDAFTEVEIKDLAVLYGLLHFASQKINESHPLKVAELQKLPEWRSVMVFAKELEANLDISEQ
jgi:hypothetical protein